MIIYNYQDPVDIFRVRVYNVFPPSCALRHGGKLSNYISEIVSPHSCVVPQPQDRIQLYNMGPLIFLYNINLLLYVLQVFIYGII